MNEYHLSVRDLCPSQHTAIDAGPLYKKLKEILGESPENRVHVKWHNVTATSTFLKASIYRLLEDFGDDVMDRITLVNIPPQIQLLVDYTVTSFKTSQHG